MGKCYRASVVADDAHHMFLCPVKCSSIPVQGDIIAVAHIDIITANIKQVLDSAHEHQHEQDN